MTSARTTDALDPDAVRRAYLKPIDDLNRSVAAENDRLGDRADVVALPAGSMTIPCLAHERVAESV